MPKKCKKDGCPNNVWGKGYCQFHQYLRTDKKPTQIQQFSAKRKVVNLEYDREAKKYREANPFCRINSPDCQRHTQGVHHVKGKATKELLLDKTWWLPACNPCNNYIETHSAWAKENGFKKSNHTQ